MSIEIYKADFSTRYQLTHAISLQMTVYYNDIGKIQIISPVSDYNILSLKKGNIIYDTNRGDTYIIVNTKCDTPRNRIVANGYTCNWLLNKRVIAEEVSIVNVENDVYTIVSNNLRGLTRINIGGAEGYDETYSGESIFADQVIDAITPALEDAGLGHKMVWDDKLNEWTFKIYKGNDLTSGIHAIAFVEEQGTCSDLVIDDDIANFKNVAYVKYRLRNDTEPVLTVGDAADDNRFEIYFETSVSQEDGETAADTEARARAYATMQLGKYINRQSFKVQIDASELGTLYNIGDIVSCVSVRFGVSFDARITGVKYTMDVTGEKTEIILGDPILTALGEAKLNAKK